MIYWRRAEHGSAIGERYDLFNQLINAHADDDILSEEELIGMYKLMPRHHYFY